MDMFTSGDSTKPRVPIDKIRYRFKYEFEDEGGRSSTMTVEDWEIGALYTNCLRRAGGDEDVAIEKVRRGYEKEFLAVPDPPYNPTEFWSSKERAIVRRNHALHNHS